jgi:hypothetical protein
MPVTSTEEELQEQRKIHGATDPLWWASSYDIVPVDGTMNDANGSWNSHDQSAHGHLPGFS